MTQVAGEEPMTDICKFSMLIGAILASAVYLQVLRNRQYWVIMETLFGVVSVLCLPFADKMIASYQSTGSNSLALYLFRIMICARVAQASVIFLTRKSGDPTVAIGISISNILTEGIQLYLRGLANLRMRELNIAFLHVYLILYSFLNLKYMSRMALVMCALHGIYHTSTISEKHLKVDAIVCSLLLVGDLFQISKVTTREGSLTIGDPVSFHLSVDGLLSFVFASWIFGFPDMFLYAVNPNISPNEGQVALAKVIGCMVFGLAVLSFAALCFKKNDDGVAVLQAKLMFYLPTFLFGTLICITDAQYRSQGHVFMFMTIVAALGGNALYSVWQNRKEKEL